MLGTELMELLLKSAVEFQKDDEAFDRNSHMFDYGGIVFGSPAWPIENVVRAAVLTGFLNHVAMHNCGMDYGMYLSDFLAEVKKGKRGE